MSFGSISPPERLESYVNNLSISEKLSPETKKAFIPCDRSINSNRDIRSSRRPILSSSLSSDTHQQHPAQYLQQHQTSYLQHRPIFHINECKNDDTNEISSSSNSNVVHLMDHPEPQLLASSVGKGINGRIIPSSSTISLLSLNQEFPPKFIHPNNQTAAQSSQPATSLAKNLETRSYLNLQRLQQYSKTATTPTTTAATTCSSSSGSLLAYLNHPNSVEYVTIQPLQVSSSVANSMPSSPNLDPTSIGGSPSRFWLSSQTPPIGGINSNNKKPAHQFQTQTAKRWGGNGDITGDDSPILNPVQTPLDDPPMTPLLLTNKSMDYFGHYYSHNLQDLGERERDDTFAGDDGQYEERINLTINR
ncbi:hypothetical protein KGF56_004350 [Candida oxycetoniae]|uniref:Uncharacterized protein n=1 Tax=Candida oxycetoniae TaxID=497107 RepID=A0AAI9WWM3_9ASCO|nr:uncharacterized protein KGF56_004350 [Candida oxycetoniae]KAI3402889.2 hypothetical protein KGF56_004350 [Candida oxycetoniae]